MIQAPTISEKLRHDLFAIPVFEVQWDDVSELNEALYDRIQNEKKNNAGILISNKGGWHSDYSLFQSDKYEFIQFKQMVFDLLTFALKSIYGIDYRPRPIHEWSFEAWANINYKGSKNVSHDHTKDENQWSGIYYLETGGDNQDEIKGKTYFEDKHTTDSGLRVNRIPILKNAHKVEANEFCIRPNVGKMVLFPGTLHHRVEEYLGNNERITIAFNVKSEDFALYKFQEDKSKKSNVSKWLWYNFRGPMKIQVKIRNFLSGLY